MNQKFGDNLHPKELRVCVCDFPNFSWKQDFFAVSRDMERDSDLKLWKWVQNFERKKGGFGVQMVAHKIQSFNHLVLKLHGEFDLIYYTREVVAQRKSLRKNTQERVSKQASKQARSRKLLIDKGVHGRNYCCGATTTTTTTTHSLLGKLPPTLFFSFDFEESMAPYQKKILNLFLDDGFF